jgi:hypothetical protein
MAGILPPYGVARALANLGKGFETLDDVLLRELDPEEVWRQIVIEQAARA